MVPRLAAACTAARHGDDRGIMGRACLSAGRSPWHFGRPGKPRADLYSDRYRAYAARTHHHDGEHSSADVARADQSALRYRARKHDAWLVHVRRRKASGHLQRPLCSALPSATGIPEGRHDAPGHHRAPRHERPPQGRKECRCRGREARCARAIIIGADFYPDRRIVRRPSYPGHPPADEGRRLGRHPRGHHRAVSARRISATACWRRKAAVS